MNDSLHLRRWFDWLADVFVSEERLPRDASPGRRGTRRLVPITKALAHPELKGFEGLPYWEDARLSLIRASLNTSSLIRDIKRRSVRQTERLGIMALLAYVDGASGSVEAVRRSIAERGCNWTFHRIYARVKRFLCRNPREKRIALCFHYEQFKCAEHQKKHAGSIAKIKRENPDASESQLFQKIRPFLLEGMERPKGRLTFATEAEERALDELLDRSKTLKSRG